MSKKLSNIQKEIIIIKKSITVIAKTRHNCATSAFVFLAPGASGMGESISTPERGVLTVSSPRR